VRPDRRAGTGETGGARPAARGLWPPGRCHPPRLLPTAAAASRPPARL